MRINKYIAYKCKNCGKWSGKQINKFNFDLRDFEVRNILNNLMCTCKYESCSKTFKFKKVGVGIETIHEWFGHNHDMIIFIKDKNKLANKNTDFYCAGVN